MTYIFFALLFVLGIVLFVESLAAATATGTLLALLGGLLCAGAIIGVVEHRSDKERQRIL